MTINFIDVMHSQMIPYIKYRHIAYRCYSYSESESELRTLLDPTLSPT